MVLQGALFNHAWLGLESPCPLCNHPQDTLRHGLWQCPERSSNNTQSHQSGETTWRTTATIPMYAVEGAGAEQVTGTGLWEQMKPIPTTNLVFGADGSGGPASKDKRLRQCSFAVVALDKDTRQVVATHRQHSGITNSAPGRSSSPLVAHQIYRGPAGKQHRCPSCA